MSREIINQSFVVYQTMVQQCEALDGTNPELAGKLRKAIMDYGIYGEWDSDPIIDALMVTTKFQIDAAQERHIASKKNGSTGGRKTQYDHEEIRMLINSGWSKDEVCNKVGCSPRTVERALSGATKAT